MADNVTPKRRSEIMSNIRAKAHARFPSLPT